MLVDAGFAAGLGAPRGVDAFPQKYRRTSADSD
jgi:hypothetical protein